MQPGPGSERANADVLYLKDMVPAALKCIAARADEIACVCVSPLQGLNPGSPPPSDLVLLDAKVRKTADKGNAWGAARDASDRRLATARSEAKSLGRASARAEEVALGRDEVSRPGLREATRHHRYRAWLHKLKSVCSGAGVPLLFDEVYTGFRMAPGGAQEYYGVDADVVVYGKTLGGGLANGVVCGPSKLMKRFDETRPEAASF